MSEKRVVITGVSRGLGLALAHWFQEQGHSVAGCARSAEPPTGWDPDKHPYHSVDLSDDDTVQRWSTKLLSDFGTPDLLINNAAIINRSANLWEIEDEEFSQLIDINISGVARVIRHFVPAMIERRSGVVVNFSSGWGRSTSPEVAPYCASKWAIEGLTQAMSQELPSRLAAVAFNPGIIDTAMLQSCFGGDASQFPGPSEWVNRAAPFLDSLGPQHNGQALTCP